MSTVSAKEIEFVIYNLLPLKMLRSSKLYQAVEKNTIADHVETENAEKRALLNSF